MTHVPFAQVGGGLRGRGGLSVGAGGGGLPAGVRGGGHQGGRGGLVAGAGRRGFAVHFHVFSQGAGVGVRLVAASHFAVVGLVAGVDMRVLLPVAAVGEAPVTALEFTFERLLPCRRQWASTAISGGGGTGSSASLTPTARSLPGPLSPALPRLLSPRNLLSLALPFRAGPAEHFHAPPLRAHPDARPAPQAERPARPASPSLSPGLCVCVPS